MSAAGQRTRQRGLRAAVLAAAALLTVAFLALAAWQVKRLAWKEALIAHVDARLRAAPQPFPTRTDWPALGRDDEYRRVHLQGRWARNADVLVQATTVLGGGFWVLTPLQLDGNDKDSADWVWVNRGFVPPEQRDARQRPALAATAQLTGLLRLTEPGGGPLRRNEPAADRWYSRDVAALSARHPLPGAVAPVFVDESADPADAVRSPRPGLTVVQFPNNHLVYALTWFALAAMVVAGAGYLVWDDRRRLAAADAARD